MIDHPYGEHTGPSGEPFSPEEVPATDYSSDSDLGALSNTFDEPTVDEHPLLSEPSGDLAVEPTSDPTGEWSAFDADQPVHLGTDLDPDMSASTLGGDTADETPQEVNDLRYWFHQDTGYTCGPASATQIIDEFTGANYTNEDTVAAYARQQGWLTDGKGMPLDDMDDLLTHFGVPSHVEQAGMTGPAAIATLEQELNQGRAVVMFVDASEYWPAGSAPANSYHFVRIVGIDEQRGVAILSDSGIDSGKGEEVPLATLEQAWDESNENTNAPSFSMVVSDQAEPAPVLTTDTTTDTTVPTDTTTDTTVPTDTTTDTTVPTDTTTDTTVPTDTTTDTTVPTDTTTTDPTQIQLPTDNDPTQVSPLDGTQPSQTVDPSLLDTLDTVGTTPAAPHAAPDPLADLTPHHDPQLADVHLAEPHRADDSSFFSPQKGFVLLPIVLAAGALAGHAAGKSR